MAKRDPYTCTVDLPMLVNHCRGALAIGSGTRPGCAWQCKRPQHHDVRFGLEGSVTLKEQDAVCKGQ